MARKGDVKHGADHIPANQLEEVKHLLAAGDKTSAGKLLDSLCVKHKLKNYEAHHLAASLMRSQVNLGPNHPSVRNK